MLHRKAGLHKHGFSPTPLCNQSTDAYVDSCPNKHCSDANTLTRSLTSLAHSLLAHSFTHARTRSLACSLTRLLTPLTLSLTHSYSRTHTLIPLVSSLHRLQQQGNGCHLAQVQLAAAPLPEGYQQPAPLQRPIYIPLTIHVSHLHHARYHSTKKEESAWLCCRPLYH